MKLALNLPKITFTLITIMPFVSMAAPNPVSWDKMIEYVASATTLSAADWAAICSSGSPTDASGCYGNINSTAFAKVNKFTGGFQTYTNINPTNAPEGSVFVQAFYAGTNTPAVAGQINITVATGSVAKCGVYLQQGTALDSGVPTINTGTASASVYDTGPTVISHIDTINSTTTAYPTYTTGGTFAPLQPFYVLCGGISATDGSTSTSILNQITAG